MNANLEPLLLKIRTFRHEGPDALLDPTSDTFNLQDYMEEMAFQSEGKESQILRELARIIRKWPFDEARFKILSRDLFSKSELDATFEGLQEWQAAKDFIARNLFQDTRLPNEILTLITRNLKLNFLNFPQLDVGRGDLAGKLKDFFSTSDTNAIRHLVCRYMDGSYIVRMNSSLAVAQRLHQILGKGAWKRTFDGDIFHFTWSAGFHFAEKYCFAELPYGKKAFASSLVEGEITWKDLNFSWLGEKNRGMPPAQCNFNGRILEIDYCEADFWNFDRLLLVNNGDIYRAYSLKVPSYTAAGMEINGHVRSPLCQNFFLVADVEEE